MADHSQIFDEQKIDLRQATRLLGPNGRPTHLSTVVRAIIKGIKLQSGDRVFLEALRFGGRWITSCHRALQNQPLMGASEPATPRGWF